MGDYFIDAHPFPVYVAAMKGQPNYSLYIRVLRRMSSEARLMKAFELTELSKELFVHGLHRRFPRLMNESCTKYTLSGLRNITTGITSCPRTDLPYSSAISNRLSVFPSPA
jgi:hypothetical protein